MRLGTRIPHSNWKPPGSRGASSVFCKSTSDGFGVPDLQASRPCLSTLLAALALFPIRLSHFAFAFDFCIRLSMLGLAVTRSCVLCCTCAYAS